MGKPHGECDTFFATSSISLVRISDTRMSGLSRVARSCTGVCAFVYQHVCVHIYVHPDIHIATSGYESERERERVCVCVCVCVWRMSGLSCVAVAVRVLGACVYQRVCVHIYVYMQTYI